MNDTDRHYLSSHPGQRTVPFPTTRFSAHTKKVPPFEAAETPDRVIPFHGRKRLLTPVQGAKTSASSSSDSTDWYETIALLEKDKQSLARQTPRPRRIEKSSRLWPDKRSAREGVLNRAGANKPLCPSTQTDWNQITAQPESSTRLEPNKRSLPGEARRLPDLCPFAPNAADKATAAAPLRLRERKSKRNPQPQPRTLRRTGAKTTLCPSTQPEWLNQNEARQRSAR
ncbi:MAG: hypothetical protein M1837_000810 [Sclerophora amabilis]|nr:MAG: hypothetical protein M1837_000810 [Sclerophora amabilis]